MNVSPSLQLRRYRATSTILAVVIAGLASAAVATDAPKSWPTTAPYTVAIEALDSALTRAGHDRAFRDELKKSSESARKAIEKHANLTIPNDRVFVFYEPQAGINSTPPDNSSAGTNKSMDVQPASKSSELVHVFCLPPLTANDQSKTYKYEDWFRCCYDQWRRQ